MPVKTGQDRPNLFHRDADRKPVEVPIMKTRAKVSLAFAKGTDGNLEELARAVRLNLYGNPRFPMPPVAAAGLDEAIEAYGEAMAATAQGGTAATAFKKQCREVLVNGLRLLASYVETESADDMAALLSSGFMPWNLNRTRRHLETPVIRKAVPGGGGTLRLTLSPVRNARSYQIDVALVDRDGSPEEFELHTLTTRSRGVVLPGLQPGRCYALQARAIGGVSGVSGWSLPVRQWCL